MTLFFCEQLQLCSTTVMLGIWSTCYMDYFYSENFEQHNEENDDIFWYKSTICCKFTVTLHFSGPL